MSPLRLATLRNLARESKMRAIRVVNELATYIEGLEIHDDEYRAMGPDDLGFTVERVGEWVFVGWEAPRRSGAVAPKTR